MSAGYDNIRSAVLKSGSDSRVEVNQRALIDKILARYASAGAVYRELLQNSNDAEARTAELHFTTVQTPKGPIVTQVAYRNDGLPFRPQDWSRLRKIAEGNPDVSKVGAFGVGAYTMFSICEEPLVVSGGQAMAFAWKGDALWVRLAPSPVGNDPWTSFVLQSRDPYPLPDFVEFGQFLCASLTFTNSLNTIHVFVDEVNRLSISKRQVGVSRIVSPPRATSWWAGDGAVTTSPRRIFQLGRSDGSITETTIEMTVDLDGENAKVLAKYVSAIASTRVPTDMAKKMQRVTKKRPPPEVKVEIFIDAGASSETVASVKKNDAAAITNAFSPKMGAGRVFIGFRTSQTTGLAAHLAAPLLPTVEREAIDFQDPTLRVYNIELLAIAGILMRLTLEHSMGLLGLRYAEAEPERRVYEEKEKHKSNDNQDATGSNPEVSKDFPAAETAPEGRGSSLFSFARFMSSGVKKIADVIASADFIRHDDDDVMRPPDTRPLSPEEHEAILLMRAFSPQQSTPDDRVGAVIAKGFEMCFPEISPPVLTNSGVVRGADARLPFSGIEGFVKRNVVRSIILKNAKSYLLHVAGCHDLTLQDLSLYLQETPLGEDEVVTLLKWWTKFARVDHKTAAFGPALKQNVSFFPMSLQSSAPKPDERTNTKVLKMSSLHHYLEGSKLPSELPMPDSVLPKSLRDKVPSRVFTDRLLESWFAPLPFQAWAVFICQHPCLTKGNPEDSKIRLKVLVTLSQEYSRQSGPAQLQMQLFLTEKLSNVRCIPVYTGDSTVATDFPKDLYLSSAELAIFDGLGSFKKVSPTLASAGVADEFLLAVGVRKTISMDFLFTQLDSLRWNRNPKPLISYLRSVSLTSEDLEKLRSTQYLPEVRDKTRTYAPSELFLPKPELEPLPFLKLLQWPSTDLLHERSPDTEFLKKLGCRLDPPLETMIDFLKSDTKDEQLQNHVLSFIGKRLGAGGAYESQYGHFMDVKFLPATVKDPLDFKSVRKELEAPNNCYSNGECSCLGFPILEANLLTVVSEAKSVLASRSNKDIPGSSQKVLQAFEKIFKYLSSRATDLDKKMLHTLARAPFIPHWNETSVQWFRPNEIYFVNVNDEDGALTEKLFLTTPFTPFLATVGVKAEPSTEDIFRLLVSAPREVLEKLGSESKYKALLRRISAHGVGSITKDVRNSPFLLGYRIDESEEDSTDKGDTKSPSESTSVKSTEATAKYTLAKAEDICIIDNSLFSRLFKVLSAPQESDLERFYERLGSAHISKSVGQKYMAVGGQRSNTALTIEFTKRIRERRPLLVSSIVSGPLVGNAAALLDDDQLDVYEVTQVKALYKYKQNVKTQYVTCSASAVSKKRLSIFVTQNFDWFHVGNAIGSVILQRCNVQDAFFIGSLLEAPLNQLRMRGFPVDRILKGSEPIERPTLNHGQNLSSTVSKPDPKSTSVEGGFESILQQMFPDCQPEHIRRLLGETPTLESLRGVADRLADGKYPRIKKRPNQASPPAENQSPPSQVSHSQTKRPNSRRAGGNNALSRAFKGLGAGLASIKPSSPVPLPDLNHRQNSSHGSDVGERRRRRVPEAGEGDSESPAQDAASQTDVEGVLKKSVRSSRPVSAGGISSPGEQLVSVPEDVERAAGACEVVPAQDLKPCAGPRGNGKTDGGIRVFASRKHAQSEEFLGSNWEVVERFASVLTILCSVYELRLDTIAIFHEPVGKTIAFNAGRALHFNIRYFVALHIKPGQALGMDCYSYWFTTMAHELAHNIAIPHAQKHGFYTESFVSSYMPKLLAIMSGERT